MRLRTFEAPTLKAVMQQVHRDMGSEAIIISAHSAQDGKGVVVRAALENRPIDWPTKIQPIESGLDARYKARLRVEQDERSEEPAAEQAKERDGGHKISHPTRQDILRDVLEWHGVPEAMIDSLLQHAPPNPEMGATARLTAALERQIVCRPLPAVPSAPLVLIGPPGAGKTVTAAKLAASAVLMAKRVDLVTLDSRKAGGTAQCAAFADLLDQEWIGVRSYTELNALLCSERYVADGVHAIVDMPAINPFDSHQVMHLAECLDTARSETGAEAVLVWSAGTNHGDACDMAEIFAEIGATRVIVTGADVTRRFGGALAALDGCGLPLAQISATPFLAEGLMDASAHSLAELIVDQPKNSMPLSSTWPTNEAGPSVGPDVASDGATYDWHSDDT